MQNSRKVIFGIAMLGIAASLCHGAFFYKAEGYMSPETAIRLGLLKDDEARFSDGVVFRKSENGGYDYRKGRAITFIGQMSHTEIDLLAECERLRGCELRD
jgi:hypothetical protein